MNTNLELSPTTFVILRTLAKKHPNPQVFKIADIAQETGLCRKTVRNHLKALRALDLVKAERLSSGSSYVFSVHPNAFLSLGFANEKVRSRIARKLDSSRCLV